jgi:hypothetical protein
MQARSLAVLYRFGPTDPDRVPFHLKLQIGFFDAWNFRDDDQIVVLPENVQWGVAAAPAQAGTEPTASAKVSSAR